MHRGCGGVLSAINDFLKHQGVVINGVGRGSSKVRTR